MKTNRSVPPPLLAVCVSSAVLGVGLSACSARVTAAEALVRIRDQTFNEQVEVRDMQDGYVHIQADPKLAKKALPSETTQTQRLIQRDVFYAELRKEMGLEVCFPASSASGIYGTPTRSISDTGTLEACVDHLQTLLGRLQNDAKSGRGDLSQGLADLEGQLFSVVYGKRAPDARLANLSAAVRKVTYKAGIYKAIEAQLKSDAGVSVGSGYPLPQNSVGSQDINAALTQIYASRKYTTQKITPLVASAGAPGVATKPVWVDALTGVQIFIVNFPARVGKGNDWRRWVTASACPAGTTPAIVLVRVGPDGQPNPQDYALQLASREVLESAYANGLGTALQQRQGQPRVFWSAIYEKTDANDPNLVTHEFESFNASTGAFDPQGEQEELASQGGPAFPFLCFVKGRVR